MLIVYMGNTPAVSVPTHQLSEVHRGIPIDVPADVAEDLTIGGASNVWKYAAEADVTNDNDGEV
jgi:hypothetical protein